MARLSVSDHDRAAAGLRYVYPVVSRRAGGVSIGINLNPNNACNWRCVYCQVPDLVRGSGPEIDLPLLERELVDLLEDVLHGDFMERRVPAGSRRLVDIAFSGNGEPTSSPQLRGAIDCVARARAELPLPASIPVRLITNGSLLARAEVAACVERLGEIGGEVWFKLDSATAAGAWRLNSVRLDPERQLERLRRAAELCPTWIQTCVFAREGEPPSAAEQDAYLACVRRLVGEGVPLRGVLLYELARPSMQPEARILEPLPAGWLEHFARRIEKAGLLVQRTGDALEGDAA